MEPKINWDSLLLTSFDHTFDRPCTQHQIHAIGPVLGLAEVRRWKCHTQRALTERGLGIRPFLLLLDYRGMAFAKLLKTHFMFLKLLGGFFTVGVSDPKGCFLKCLCKGSFLESYVDWNWI